MTLDRFASEPFAILNQLGMNVPLCWVIPGEEV